MPEIVVAILFHSALLAALLSAALALNMLIFYIIYVLLKGVSFDTLFGPTPTIIRLNRERR